MPVSERLQLLTAARDQASPDLLKLSGLLETIGEQADRLDPMRIRVRVDDRELQRLQRRLAQTQGQDIVRAGFATTAGGTGGGANTLDSSVVDRLTSNISDLESTFDDIAPSTGSPVSGTGAALLAGAIASGGGGGGPSRSGNGEAAAQFANAAPIPNSQVLERMFSPAAAAQGDVPFVQPDEFLGDEFPSKSFMQALDTDSLADTLGLDSALELPTASRSDFVDNLDALAEGDSILDLQDTDFFDNEAFRRRKLVNSLSNLRVGMTEFYDIIAALLPVMLTFLGTMPLVIGGLAGLAAAAVGAAGALGAVAGLGLLGASMEEAGGGVPGFEDIAAVFDGLKEDFVEAFADPAQQLAPLFRDGVDALSRLFDRLGAVAEMLPGMSEQFRAVGRFVENFLVSGFRNLLQLAEAASPIFARIGEFFRDANLTQGFAAALEMALPLLAHLSSLLVAGIDDLLLFSEGMSRVLIVTTQVIASTLSFITSLLEMVPLVNNGARALGSLVGILLTFTSVVLLASRALAIYTAVSTFLADKTLAGMAASLKASVVGFYASAKGALGAAASYVIAAGAATKFAIALGSVGLALGVVTGGLGAVLGAVGGLAAGFLGLGTDIDDATSSLEEFQRQQKSLRSGSGAFVGALDREVYVDYSVENRNNYQGMDMDDMQFATARGTDSFDPNSRNDDTYDSAL